MQKDSESEDLFDFLNQYQIKKKKKPANLKI